MSSVLDRAAFMEYMEKLKTPKKENPSGQDESKPDWKSDYKPESKPELKPESTRTNEAAAKDSSEDLTPTPSPSKKSEAKGLPSKLTVIPPAAQFNYVFEADDLFKAPSYSSARAIAGSTHSVHGKSIHHASHGGSDITEDLFGEDDPFTRSHSGEPSDMLHGSVTGGDNTTKSLSLGKDEDLLFDYPASSVKSLDLRPETPLVLKDESKAEDDPACDTQEASATRNQEVVAPKTPRSSLLSDGYAFLQSLITTPVKSYRGGVVVKNPDEIDVDDDDDAAGEVWVTPTTGEEDQERGEATTKKDDGSPTALTGNKTIAANGFMRAASTIASESGQYPSAASSSVVSGPPSPPVTRPNRFDEGREAYLAELAAALTPAPLFSAGRPTGPKSAVFITGSAPTGAARHARVYKQKELLEIGRQYRNVVLATLAINAGEKKLGIAMISAGRGGAIKAVGDFAGELGLGSRRERVF
ncbi:MAG: hypothetical protein Q9228_006027 [Teloschistes exilis]